jgi:hypothetical protein
LIKFKCREASLGRHVVWVPDAGRWGQLPAEGVLGVQDLPAAVSGAVRPIRGAIKAGVEKLLADLIPTARPTDKPAN